MGKYLLKIKPLSPYVLGTERSFSYDGVDNNNQTRYIIDSLTIPNQTSLLGMLRYILLDNNKLLKSDFNYSSEDIKKMNELIGPESFQFKKEKQEFGYIKSISPVFIINNNDEYIVKTPFFYTNENECTEMDMCQEFETSNGTINIPTKKSFNSKNWYQNSYYNLDKKEIVKETIFSSQYRVGNRISNTKEDGFFKMEQIVMNDNYCFGLEIECEDFPSMAIGYMGKKRASFRIEAIETDFKLLNKVKDGFTNKQDWYYALSDIYLDSYPKWKQFCVVEKKLINNIETNLDEKDFKKKYKKNTKLNLINSGSVFYKDKPFEYENKHLNDIGYNYLVKLEGKQNDN